MRQFLGFGMLLALVLVCPVRPANAKEPWYWVRMGNLPGADRAWQFTEDLGGNLYVGTGANGDVFKSTDKGVTWTNTAELAGAMHIEGLMTASDGTIYAGSYNGAQANGAVYKSNNGGTSWVQTAALPSGVTGVWTFFETQDGAIYAGGNCNAGPPAQLIKTSDGGDSWQAVAQFENNCDVRAFIQASDGTMYAGTAFSSGCVNRSEDNGATWAPTSLAATRITSLIEASDGSIYAGTSNASGGHVVGRTTNHGTTWTTVSLPEVNGLLEASDGYVYAACSQSTSSVYRAKLGEMTEAAWASYGILDGLGYAAALWEDADHYLYVGTYPSGEIFRSNVPIPEPATVSLLALGALGLLRRRRVKRRG